MARKDEGVSDHCCRCEASRQFNRRVFSVTLALLTAASGVAGLAAYKHNWLALAGWGSWGLLGTVTLLFSGAMKSSCAEHGAAERT